MSSFKLKEKRPPIVLNEAPEVTFPPSVPITFEELRGRELDLFTAFKPFTDPPSYFTTSFGGERLSQVKLRSGFVLMIRTKGDLIVEIQMSNNSPSRFVTWTPGGGTSIYNMRKESKLSRALYVVLDSLGLLKEGEFDFDLSAHEVASILSGDDLA